MIPKFIHLCWFSNEPFPIEIEICQESWKRLLPDYKIRHWTYADAKAINCKYIDEALAAKKWAFASDVVRFYALYTEGGIYMDSDMLVKRRFEQFIPEHGFATFHEHIGTVLQLQAAFLFGEKGNAFCKDAFEYYQQRSFIKHDGSYDMEISPRIMVRIAQKRGYKLLDVEQHLEDDVIIYPGYFVTPCKKIQKHPDAIAQHQIYGSWRKRKLGRRFELFMKSIFLRIRFTLFRR